MERIEEMIEETSGEMNMDSLYIAWSEDRRSIAPKTLRETRSPAATSRPSC